MFEMLNYDMILWIDFLERNRAEIDYRCRKVRFNLGNRDQFKFAKRHIKTIMIISSIKARKMLSKGCKVSWLM